MATRKTPAAARPPARAARARAPVAAPAAAAPAADDTETPESRDSLLRAGLKALSTARDDMVRHQAGVIERLLGLNRPEPAVERPTPPLGLPGLDSFGLRKFEDVFDQRVAAALQRLGVPSAQELQALRDEVQQLRAALDATRPAGRKR